MKKLIFIQLFLFAGINPLFSQTCSQSGTIYLPTSTTLSSSLSVTAYIGETIIMDGNFIVDNSFSIENCTIYINNSVTISVADGADLKLYDNKLFSCGNVMWHGIEVAEDGELDMQRNKLEDAEVGLNTRNLTSNVLIIDNVFNKNNVHVLIEQADCNFITLYGNTFSCKDLLNPYSFNGNTLEAPFAGSQTQVSVWGISNSNVLKIGSPSFNVNAFSDCKWGVRLEDTEALILHNTFLDIRKNITLMNNLPADFLMPYTAIIAFGDLIAKNIIIGGSGLNESNSFKDCNVVTITNDYRKVQFLNNDITNTQPAPPAGYTGSGTTGVTVNHINNLNNTSVIIKNNNFSRIDNSINYYFANQSTINDDHFEISDNKIDGETNIKGIRGIYIHGNIINSNQSGFNSFTVFNNDIKLIQVGIALYNLSGIETSVEENEIEINWGNSQTRIGIDTRFSNSQYLYNNLVKGPGYSLAEITYKGIRTESSSKTTILCNKIRKFGQSLWFKGTTPSYVHGNILTHAYDGWVMGPNAVIGQQGDPSFAIDNKWIGTFTNSRTFTINTGCNMDSPLYLRGPIGGPFFPAAATNKTVSSNSVGEEYNSNPPLGGLKLVSNPGPVLNCPHFPLNFSLPLLQAIVREKIDFPNFPLESKWNSKKMVYDEIKIDSSLLNDPIIDSFALAGTTSYSELSLISDEIGLRNFNQAITLSNSFVPSNLPEENYQIFYKIYSLFFSQLQLSQNDYDLLVEIAEQCPLKGGRAVYEARVLREFIDKQNYFYDDECEENIQKSVFNSNMDSHKSGFFVYPNPNNGNFTLKNETTFSGTFVLFDAIGKIVYQSVVDGSQQVVSTINDLENGMYFYEMLFEDGAKNCGKITILK